jgi:hypothetical protein
MKETKTYPSEYARLLARSTGFEYDYIKHGGVDCQFNFYPYVIHDPAFERGGKDQYRHPVADLKIDKNKDRIVIELTRTKDVAMIGSIELTKEGFQEFKKKINDMRL